jgi:hypothetical protein
MLGGEGGHGRWRILVRWRSRLAAGSKLAGGRFVEQAERGERERDTWLRLQNGGGVWRQKHLKALGFSTGRHWLAVDGSLRQVAGCANMGLVGGCLGFGYGLLSLTFNFFFYFKKHFLLSENKRNSAKVKKTRQELW